MDDDFLQAMKENPEDRELRLVYADWLEDQGDSRAEIIRQHHEIQTFEAKLKAAFTKVAKSLSNFDEEWLKILFPSLLSVEIRSPTIGTFYSQSEPGAPPFVSVGNVIQPDTVVGLVESMKVFNEIPASVSGIVESIHVRNEQAVEYDQPLMRICWAKPAPLSPTDLLDLW